MNSKTTKSRIYLSSPHMGGKEIEYINTAFKENWIAPLGPNVDGFEGDICMYTNVAHCAALSSGTAAIHLSLIILGVKQGDEVLASDFTFSATINPIVYQGATPILIESEPETWNMSPQFLEEAIKDRLSNGKKPKAILLVHLYGMPANMEEIMAISRKYEIPVIEDAAEALGSSSNERKAGSFGDIGIFSFNGNKIITTSGGGVLVSNNKEYVTKARFLATQARDKAPHYEHSHVGYNYRMSNISAGIGRGQMQVLDERVKRKREIWKQYHKEFYNLFEFQNPKSTNQHYSNRWLTTILTNSFDQREAIRLTLEKENIESRPLWKPMHLQPIFKEYPYYGDGLSERLFAIGLCLPSGSNLTAGQQSNIIEIIKSSQ